MQERRWEDLDSDCLTNILGRLDLESRLVDVPFVCKKWHQALLNPLCWQILVFPLDVSQSTLAEEFEYSRSFISRLIKFVLNRSQGCVTKLKLPLFITREDLIYVSNVTPALKFLSLSLSPFLVYYGDIVEFFAKWKNLEVFELERCNMLEYSSANDCNYLAEVIKQLGLHCKNLVKLTMERTCFVHDTASAIVFNFPAIKCLILDFAIMEKVNLLLILQGCQDLELLYVRRCLGFDEDDEDILKLACRIKDFRCDYSRTDIYGYYEDYMDFYYKYMYDD